MIKGTIRFSNNGLIWLSFVVCVAVFYKDLDRFSVYRTNQKYFAETIQPTETVINRLRSADCLTDIQQRLTIRQRHRKDQRKRSNMEINAELLHVVRSFSNETRYSDFIGCLDKSNQNVVTKFEERGGATLKVKIVTERWRRQKQLVQQFVQGLNDLENVTQPWPAELDKLMSQLNDDDIEILNSFPDRQAVVWIWSQSHIAFQNLRSLDEQHSLVKLLSCLSKTPQSATGTTHAPIKRHSIDIDIDQFKKAIVMFPVFVNFMSSLEVGEEEFVVGVTKLRTEIYILCGSNSSPNVIRVFQDTEPFLPHGKIELKSVKFPEDIVSSEKENCLYVIDTCNQCIWKIKRESDDNYNFTNWLSTGIDWSSLLSLTRDDNLLIVRGCGPRSRLEIYGRDANLLLSIDLPPEIEFPQHAVETSTGHFIISHQWADEAENSEDPIFKWEIWEVARNGKMVIHRFSPQVVGQEIRSAYYLLIDSDDRVLVADAATSRVTLLDSDLRWNRILIEDSRYQPYKMAYDEAKKQLVATGAYKGSCPKIYNFK